MISCSPAFDPDGVPIHDRDVRVAVCLALLLRQCVQLEWAAERWEY